MALSFLNSSLSHPHGVVHRSQAAAPCFYSFTLGHAPNRKETLSGSQRKGVGGRGIFFLLHLDFIAGRVPTTDGQLLASDGPPPLVLYPLLPHLAHTHELKPPDRKYRLGSQRGILIQTSLVEQPEVAAPTPCSFFLLSLFHSVSSAHSFWLCGLQPAACTCPQNTCTHKDTHMLMIAQKQEHTHHRLVQS